MDGILGNGACDYSYRTAPGVPSAYKASGFRLRNSGQNVFAASVDGVEVDNVDVSLSGFHPPGMRPTGSSLMLNGSLIGSSDLDDLNDSASSWELNDDTADTYETVGSDENIGTPGEANPAVP